MPHQKLEASKVFFCWPLCSYQYLEYVYNNARQNPHGCHKFMVTAVVDFYFTQHTQPMSQFLDTGGSDRWVYFSTREKSMRSRIMSLANSSVYNTAFFRSSSRAVFSIPVPISQFRLGALTASTKLSSVILYRVMLYSRSSVGLVDVQIEQTFLILPQSDFVNTVPYWLKIMRLQQQVLRFKKRQPDWKSFLASKCMVSSMKLSHSPDTVTVRQTSKNAVPSF